MDLLLGKIGLSSWEGRKAHLFRLVMIFLFPVLLSIFSGHLYTTPGPLHNFFCSKLVIFLFPVISVITFSSSSIFQFHLTTFLLECLNYPFCVTSSILLCMYTELNTLEWDILNPDRLIWISNVHILDFILLFWISLLYKSYVW